MILTRLKRSADPDGSRWRKLSSRRHREPSRRLPAVAQSGRDDSRPGDRGRLRHRLFPHALTLGVVAAAVLAGIVPGAAALLEYDRAAVAGGELWRLLTCHLAHLSPEHLLWDALTFAGLGWMCEQRGRGRLVLTLVVSAVAIPAVLFVFDPGLAVYRGLSGLDMALAGLLAAGELRRSPRVAGAALVVLGAKLAYELASGGALFVALDGAEAVPLAHAVGAAVGILSVGSPATEART